MTPRTSLIKLVIFDSFVQVAHLKELEHFLIISAHVLRDAVHFDAIFLGPENLEVFLLGVEQVLDRLVVYFNHRYDDAELGV